jgi:transcriptional regulator with XRE-family HTH domain
VNFIRALKQRIRETGSQKKAAESLGISAQYFNDLLRGRREPSENVLKELGFEWKIARVK